MTKVRTVFMLAGIVCAGVGMNGEAAGQSLEVRLGGVRSSFDGDRVTERGGLSGGLVGVGVVVPVAAGVAIQPELRIVQKGATYRGTWMAVADGDTMYAHMSEPLRLFYAELPLLARLELPRWPGGARPYLAAGPYFGWLLGCSSYLVPIDPLAGAGPNPTVRSDSVSVGSACNRDAVRRTEVGVAAGAGASLPLGALTAVADLRYERGLRGVVTDRTGDVHNRALSLTAGFSLPVGGRASQRRP
jgi:hypothetical protein